MGPTAPTSCGRLRSSAHTRGFGAYDRCGANGPPSRTPIDRCAWTCLAIDMVSSFNERRGTPVPLRENRSSPLGIPTLLTARRGLVIARRRAWKRQGPRFLRELRALLRNAPSSPCTRHGRRCVTGHRRTSRSDNSPLCSGARPSAQPYVACRDEIGIASDRFKGG